MSAELRCHDPWSVHEAGISIHIPELLVQRWLLLCIDVSKFIDCQDLSWRVVQDRTDLESFDGIFMPVDMAGWHVVFPLVPNPLSLFSFWMFLLWQVPGPSDTDVSGYVKYLRYSLSISDSLTSTLHTENVGPPGLSCRILQQLPVSLAVPSLHQWGEFLRFHDTAFITDPLVFSLCVGSSRLFRRFLSSLSDRLSTGFSSCSTSSLNWSSAQRRI